MNYLILILISITLCIQGYKAQSKIKGNQNIFIPAIDNSFEKFDIDRFDIEKENIFINENGVYTKRMNQSFGFAKHMVTKNSFFSVIKLYYKNTFIKEKGISFNNGAEYGIWYEFDEAGSLIREIDTDRGYDFGWQEILSYCGQHKITLAQGYETSGFQTTIYKEENASGANIWVITHQVSGDQLEEITLDGKTGTVLGKKQIEFVNH